MLILEIKIHTPLYRTPWAHHSLQQLERRIVVNLFVQNETRLSRPRTFTISIGVL